MAGVLAVLVTVAQAQTAGQARPSAGLQQAEPPSHLSPAPPRPAGRGGDEGRGGQGPGLAGRGRLVIVVLDQVSWGEVQAQAGGTLLQLIEGGAVGLVNTRKPEERGTFYNTYATMGAGAGARGGPFSEKAIAAFEQLTATSARGASLSITAPSSAWQDLLAGNRRAGERSRPGWLGSLLKRGGKPAAVAAYPGRLACSAALLLDEQGQVAAAPTGIVAEWAAGWVRAVEVGGHRGGPVLLEPAPMAVRASPADRIRGTEEVLARLLVGPVDLRRDTLVVMSIGAPDYRREVDNSPAWVVMAGAGIGPGLLTSASTRRPGWVMTTDLAPTVLELVGLPIPAEMTGHPWRVRPAADAAARLDVANRRAIANYRLRYPVTRGLIGVGAVVVIGLMVLGRRPAVARRRRVWQAVLLAFLAAPLGLVLVGPLGIENGWLLLGVIIAWSAVVAAAAGRLPGVWPVVAVTGVSAAAVLADVMTGSRAMQASALGYDPIIGARFYGVGNELMGMAVAAACIAGGFAMEGARRRWLAPLGLAYLALGLAIGLPGLGANWGGGLTAAAALGMTLLLLASGRLRWWHLAAAAGVVLAAGAGLAAADAVRATGQTHIGHLLAQIGDEGWAPLAAVVQRKAMMSWKLLLWSLMGWPLLGLLVVLAVELARPRRFAAAFAGRRAAWAGVAGGWVTAIAAALFNDSGVVAGATSMMVTGPALVYLALWAEGKAADG